ncbi:MAG: 2-dehydro-3-deoxy-D-gluconate 5-dehydrogenase [Pseudomonadales bacterium]|nr:2-dehydro-3-deoxy-D-gluconate 5-dehydrogenase [Pseudomonadales bacterium]
MTGITAPSIDMRGRSALITGAGAGIGRGIAEAFGALGARIVGAEIDPARAGATQAALREAGVEAEIHVCDVRDGTAVRALIAALDARGEGIDTLVNNVGDSIGEFMHPFDRAPEELWDALYAINLRHVFTVSQAALPLLRRRAPGATIVNVSSIEAFRAIPMCPVYSAFKHALTGFTKSLALVLGPEGIRVNTIAPETTETEQVKPSQYVKPELQEHVARWTPLGRFGEPRDMAGCAVFLASELSAWVTGTTVNADGGALAAGGFYRTPSGHWTNTPIVIGDGFGFS